ncbi:lipoprotein N-acyltransferase Lnb domain-containing protein [Lysobacter sp. A289]
MFDRRGGERRGTSHGVLIRLCLLALLWSCAFAAAATPRIGVITMQPGEIFFERFGHNAVLVADPAAGTEISYNFGFFDPTEDDFIARFVRGDMRYRLVALPLQQDLAYYRQVGRGVSLQWLDLDPAAAQAVADALEQNARPENAAYSYDYFLDNCSTRVRDILDQALGGDLRRQMGGSRGSTFRSEATRLASPDFWMWLGFDVGLGPAADRPLAFWAEAFIPMRLADALRDARNGHDEPLVIEEVELLPHRLAPAPRDLPRPWWPWLLAGIVTGAGLAWLGRHRPRLVAGIALPFWTVSGLVGALLLFIWFGTAHQFGWANQNLLLASPLAWLLLPGGWRIARGRKGGRWFGYLLTAMVALAVLALFSHWMQLLPQRNLHWILLLLPIHLGLLRALKRR